MPASVYIESSVISYLTSWPSRDVVKAGRQLITSDWWLNSRSQYEVYISALVEEEIAGGDPTAAAKRLEAVVNIPSILITSEAQRLAEALVTSKAVPDNSVRRYILKSQPRKGLTTFLLGTLSTSIMPKQRRLLLMWLKPMAGYAPFSAHQRNSEVAIMKNDLIVDEVRNNGLALAARYDNNIEAICKALKEREQTSGRMVVDRAPHRLTPKARQPALHDS